MIAGLTVYQESTALPAVENINNIRQSFYAHLPIVAANITW
jgi:hypothetical protein